jgi:hypothetical protein
VDLHVALNPPGCTVQVVQLFDLVYSGTLVGNGLSLGGAVTDKGSKQSVIAPPPTNCGVGDNGMSLAPSPMATGPGTLQLHLPQTPFSADPGTWTCPSLQDFKTAFHDP